MTMCYVICKGSQYLNNFARAGFASVRNSAYYDHQYYTDDVRRAMRFHDKKDVETVATKCGKRGVKIVELKP